MNMEQNETNLVNPDWDGFWPVDHAGIQGFETFVEGLILSLIGLFTLILILLPIKILTVILAIIILLQLTNQNSADSTSVNTTLIIYSLIIVVGITIFIKSILHYYNLNVIECLNSFRNYIIECFNLLRMKIIEFSDLFWNTDSAKLSFTSSFLLHM